MTKTSHVWICFDSWPAKKMNKWVLEQINPEILLEAEITKLKLSYFGHIISQGSLEKMMPGKIEGSRKRGRPNIG